MQFSALLKYDQLQKLLNGQAGEEHKNMNQLKKSEMLTIGAVSRITGVHIKSLRYYDKIGVLKPAFIDSETNYRYYTTSQLGIVEAIQTCIELDIPLKLFLEFTDNGGSRIHYNELLDYGQQVAEKKIHNIRAGLKMIHSFKNEIHFNEMLKTAQQPVAQDIEEKIYYVRAIADDYAMEEHYTDLEELFDAAGGAGHRIGYEYGLLYLYGENEVKRYSFIEIFPPVKSKTNVLVIPAGQYLNIASTQSAICEAPRLFSEQFAAGRPLTVIETELLTNDYDILKPVYKIKCSLLA